MFNFKQGYKYLFLALFLGLVLIPLTITAQAINDSHLQELVYEPQIDNKTSITNVHHTPEVPDTLHAITISATITDADGISSTVLYYRAEGASVFNSTALTQVGSTDEYSATIGPYDAVLTIEYYISVTDNFAHVVIDDNDGQYYSFTVIEADIDSPVISQVSYDRFTEQDNVSISCDITDSSSVLAKVSYRFNAGAWTNETMTNSSTTYTAFLGFFSIGDFIEFSIIAVDSALEPNTAIDTNDGAFYTITIEKYDDVPPNITNLLLNPEEPMADVETTISCTVTDDYSGIADVTLHYKVNDGLWSVVNFTHQGADVYVASFGTFEVGDVVVYYIKAVDNSTSSNIFIENNNDANYSFTVLEYTPSVNFYLFAPLFALSALGITVVLRRKR